MARSKKAVAAVASKSLAGKSIAFAESKTSVITTHHEKWDTKSFTQLKQDIAACQGTYSVKVEDCTHLIATEIQFANKASRIKTALDTGNILIVSYEWLVDSLESTDPVDEADYDYQKVNIATTNGNAKDNTKQHGKLTKRARDSDEEEVSAKKPKAELNTEIRSKSKVPVDTEYKDHASCEVYEDDDGLSYDATLNQTDSGYNANKFYRLQVLRNTKSAKHQTWTRWGRVGESGQSKLQGDGNLEQALKEFKKKFREKSGLQWEKRDQPPRPEKYTYIEINYEESDDEGDAPESSARRQSKTSIESSVKSEETESKLPEPVSKLISFIFNNEYFNNALIDMDYDITKMPLGKLSKKTLLKGYEVLKELASLIGDSTATGDQIVGLSNQYFSLIPHEFGRRRPLVLSNTDLIKKEVSLLENLTDMQLANEIMKSAKDNKADQMSKVALVDRQYEGLGMERMIPLDHKASEFQELSQYLKLSRGQTHGFKYEVQDIFRIERKGEHDRFNKSKFAAMGPKSDRRLLWHGSRSTNFGGILSQGLRIAPPEAPVSGYMFGKGIYLANMSSKSANYCVSYNSGGVALLLLCEAEIGKPPLKLSGSDYEAGEKAKQQNLISTWGVGRTAPLGWKDAGSVHEDLKGVMMPDINAGFGDSNEDGAGLMYDEHIVYDASQIKLRYLIRTRIS